MKNIFTIIISIFLLFSCTNGNEQINIEDEKKEAKQKIILSLGDSLTAGYGVDVNENYPSKLEKKLIENNYDYKVINAGVSGDTSAGLKSRTKFYLEQNPDIVIIVIGGNDGLRGLSTTDLKANILSIIDTFPKETKIVLGGMEVPVNLGLKYKIDFKNVYKKVADERKKIYLFPYFLDGVAGVSSLNIDDKIHPNSQGYDIIVKNLYDYLVKNDILQK